MDKTTLYIIIGIFFIAAMTASIYLKRKYKRPVNYKSMFILGVIFLPVGMSLSSTPLMVMGLLFALSGYSKKSLWEENRLSWSGLSKEEKTIKISFFSVFMVFLLTLIF